MQRCPACGQENPDGFRLCGMCGTALADAPAPAHEERKVVTILFTDLVGSTARAERLDPEDVRAALSSYYARLRAELERHGGTVEKFIGDAVMAVFGAPVAHEDDPERAVRAALAIRDAIGDELRVRTAVHTGEALVALGARPAAGDAMVAGDVVNTAARLQSAAPVNGILVGETTYRATRHAIEYRDAQPVEAKGKSAPVPVWEVVGARARFGSDVEQRPRTPLVGRERERSVLADALARARSEQSVQLVTLVGVPGIGKSRLVAELFQLVEADPELIAWRQGRSLPYGEQVSFWALGEIVKAHAGILESDDAEAAEAKLASLLKPLVVDEREREWVRRHARPLVGLEGAGRTERDEAFAAWRRLLETAAEEHPLVLVFEDLHWADDGLLDFVDHLADWATNVALLLVGTARPELLDRRPGWGGGKRNAFTLSLGALSDEETAKLLGHVLDRAVVDAGAQRAVLRRAEGNPLYAEEYARLLAEHEPGAELPLPETVQGLIAARIDALAPVEKALLQDASVIGKVFWPGAVDAERAALHALERKEFVRRDRRSSVAGETQYVFLHALVRDVAYGQIPRPQRVERHRRAAEWLAALAGDRGDDLSDLLAHHYREALALASAAGLDAGTLRGPACSAFVRASERAEALNAWAAARDLAGEALELADAEAEVVPELLLRIARSSFQTADLDVESAVRARERFLELGRVESAAEAEVERSLLLWYRGEGDAALAASERAVELVAEREPSTAKVRALANRARRDCLRGDQTTALRLGREALGLAEQLGLAQGAAHALNTIGMARVESGDAGGIADLERSIELAEEASIAYELAHGYNNLCGMLWKLGRGEEASRARRRQREVAAHYGLVVGLTWVAAEEAADAYQRGEYALVVELAERFLAEHGERSYYLEAPVRSELAQAYAALGRGGEALEQSARAEAVAREIGDPQALGSALLSRAVALAVAAPPEDAREPMDELLSRPELLQFEVLGPLALLLAELGRGSQLAAAAARVRASPWREAALLVAAERYVEAAERYRQLGSRFLEAWCRLLASEAGDRMQAEPARAVFAAEGAVPYLGRCAALLPASA